MNLKSLGIQYTAILMDPPLILPGEDSVEQNKGKISLMQFVRQIYGFHGFFLMMSFYL